MPYSQITIGDQAATVNALAEAGLVGVLIMFSIVVIAMIVLLFRRDGIARDTNKVIAAQQDILQKKVEADMQQTGLLIQQSTLLKQMEESLTAGFKAQQTAEVTAVQQRASLYRRIDERAQTVVNQTADAVHHRLRPDLQNILSAIDQQRKSLEEQRNAIDAQSNGIDRIDSRLKQFILKYPEQAFEDTS